MGSLTKEQTSIITGKLLGDGTLRRKTNTLLEVNHSYKQQDYVFWLYENLSNLVSTPPSIRKSGVNRKSCRFTTCSIPALNTFYADFYPQGNKSIPRFLKLNPLALAIWFMDDGSKDRDSVYFNTQQFSFEDQYMLLKALTEIGLEGSLNKDKIYYRIRLYKSSYKAFESIVIPYILESFRYKLLL